MLAQTDIRGVQEGISPEGVQVIRVHYSADPAKDPDTPDGNAWLERELEGYRGMNDPRWRKEMEIDFDAHGGQLLFPYLLQHEKTLYITPYDVSGFQLIAGLDYGTRNPSAFEVLAVDYDNNIHVVWEYYEPPKSRTESEEDFRARKGHKKFAEAIKACPHFSPSLPILADPSLWAKNQEAVDAKGLRSVADFFAAEGVRLTPGQAGRDLACFERIDKELWSDPAKPRLTIFRTCPWLWWEIQRLRFDEFTEATQVQHNLKEKIVDRDNHAWDALKYPLVDIFTREFSAVFPGGLSSCSTPSKKQ